VVFTFKYLKSHAAFSEETTRHRLYEMLREAVGAVNGTNLGGFPDFPAHRLNDAEVRVAFRKLLDTVVDLARVTGRVE
jgi:hypothetical protein